MNLQSVWVVSFIDQMVCIPIGLAARTMATKILEDVLDVIFPAEKAASEIVSTLLDRVNEAIQSKGSK